jgi:branched-chain amino acid aminotransferase
MIEAIGRTVDANARPDAYVRVVVSRGPGDLGIDPAKCPRATVVIVVDTIAMYPQDAYDFGIDLVTASVRRVPMESLDPRVKSSIRTAHRHGEAPIDQSFLRTTFSARSRAALENVS